MLTASSSRNFTVHWYVVCGLVVFCLFVVGGVTVCVYRCYQERRRRRNSLSEGREGEDLVDADECSPSGSSGSGSGKGYSKKERNSTHRIDEERGASGTAGKGQSSVGRQNSRSTSVEKPSSLQYGPPGAVICQGKIIQTQCYTANEKERLVRSPELTSHDEKQETMRETEGEDGNTDGNKSNLGTVEFMVGYDKERSSLAVTIVRAKNLPIKNSNIGSSDPYIKLQLLPDKRQKVKTRVLRKTLNPLFDETFTFYGIDENQLSGVTLHFVVLSFDRFSRDDVIGEVVYQLDELDPESSKKSLLTVCQPVLPKHNKMISQGRGELLLSICHHPAANRLTVVILKARSLPKMDITGLADPYVKIYLTYYGQRVAKKKTHTKKRTLNPVFNESFVFDLPTSPTSATSGDSSASASVGSSSVLAGISLEMVVLDWDQMTKNDIIGRVEIGANGSGETEQRHWADVVSSPRKQSACWHKLKE